MKTHAKIDQNRSPKGGIGQRCLYYPSSNRDISK